ncbi:hypothetical protein GBA52_015029 [Prunus armeniaca]|nr:hypothetical protein GBA52_015029 [Prunus armeniaca]
MSTWQMFADAGNNYRWYPDTPNGAGYPTTTTTTTLHSDSERQQPLKSSSRLPSMADLLLQGCSKLAEAQTQNQRNGVDADDGVGMFRNGFGRPVAIKPSSLAKASSLLQTGTGQVQTTNSRGGFSNSLFQTGSGKMVNISPEGLVRAKTLLGLGDDSDHSKLPGSNSGGVVMDAASISRSPLINKTVSVQTRCKKNEADLNFMSPERVNLTPDKPSSIKFHTAGGRSISVSTDALQRARSLLGDPELGSFLNEGDAGDSVFSFSKGRGHDERTPFSHQKMTRKNFLTKTSVYPLQSSSSQVQSSLAINSGTNLITQFDVVSNESVCKSNSKLPYRQEKPLSDKPCIIKTVENNYLENGGSLRINPVGKSLAKPLVDISNTVGTTTMNSTQKNGVKRRLGRSSISPFKKPRTSNSSTPLHKNVPPVRNGLSTLSSDNSCSKRRVSTKYPFSVTRMHVKKYFGMPPPDQNMLECLSDPVRRITASNAEKYMFLDESGLNCIGAEAFVHMLARSGALMQYTSREWVTNHYKWVVWKLACYERCHLAKSFGNFLTVSNVLEELKYRYEREVNHGHRSAIKRILEGDASPSSMVVLCISAIRSNCDPNMETSSRAENSGAAKVELTDGWYSVDAVLDALLSKQLASGKLFVGQKLRIWGAALSGWAGPVSPLEVARTVTFRLHINGTYRAHWADRLGFCKGVGAPLAFNCVKSGGGAVPCTLLGVTRIYPVLYKERLSNGRSIVRSARLESQMVQSYQERRSDVIEGIISEFQRGLEHSHLCNDSDSEGAKLLKILETATEPEILMAEMSSEQLKSFTKYRSKLEAIKQSDMEKSILKALEDAGLSEREVTPFMRVRVVGLTRKLCHGKDSSKEGLITIWNPSEKQQKTELVEGCAYRVSGLIPTSSDVNTLHLQVRGSTTTWQPLSQQAVEHFKPFFNPRKSILLSDLGKVPLSSEFDIAAFVVFVGEVYIAAHQKKQWVFVTDGSISELNSEESCDSLLAVCFCSPYIGVDSVAPINYNLTGTTVGFCNLTKRAKDQMNSLWVAEATETSAYFLRFDTPHCSHLKDAAVSTERWGRISSLTINRLKERVLCIIGASKG